MNNAEIISARENGASFSELARTSGKSELDVRRIWALRKSQPAAPVEPLSSTSKINQAHKELTIVKFDDPAIAIEKAHRATCANMKETLENAIETGRLLAEQKAKLPHGGWEPWIKANLSFSPITARRYIKCYSNRDLLKRSSTTDLTIEQLAKGDRTKVSEPKPPKLTKPIVIKKARGTLTATINDPPKGWCIITRAGCEGGDAHVLCRKCWTYDGGAMALGVDEWYYSCECPDSRRDAVLTKEGK